MDNKITTIKVVDAPTGEGKTTALINHLKTDYNPFTAPLEGGERFIVMVPLVTECERIYNALKEGGIAVYMATIEGRKNRDTLDAIERGENIITTHRFYEMEINELFKTLKESSTNKGKYFYSLFIDEEPTIEIDIKDSPLGNLPSLTPSDIEEMKGRNIIAINPDSNRINWTAPEDLSVIYRHYRKFFTGYTVYLSKEAYQGGKENPFIILMNPELWSMFKSVTVLSYRVRYSPFHAYCELFRFPIEYCHIDRNPITNDSLFKEGYIDKKPKGYKRLNICKEPHLLATFDREYKEIPSKGLSYSWYTNKAKPKQLKKIKSYMDKCIRGYSCSSILWTSFKDNMKALKIPKHGISLTNWTACNTRATNDYSNRTNVIYPINRYMNPFKASFWKAQGIVIDTDNWALNELIQFLWRSNLRVADSELSVNVYIPSERMRGLLEAWINNIQ